MFKLILLVCAVMAATIAVSSATYYTPLWNGFNYPYQQWSLGNIITPYAYGGVVGGYKGYGY